MDETDFIFSDDAWGSRIGGKAIDYALDEELRHDLNHDAVRKFIHEKNALLAMWTYDYDCGEEGPWYRFVCDIANYDIDKIKNKKGRYYVRRSLKNCTIRNVSYQWLADNAYEVYVSAGSRYSNFVPYPRKMFEKIKHKLSKEPGREAWGIFVDEKLVAYATVLIRGEKVYVAESKFDPSYSKFYPMYALYYAISHHYLNERGYRAIDNGSRPLLHDTNIGDFLLRLGWRKAYCRLGIYFTWRVRAVLIIARMFRKVGKLFLSSRQYAILESILWAQDIAKATKKH